MADINIAVAFDSAKAEQSAKNLDNKLKDMGTSAEKAKSPFDGLWKQIFAGVSVAAIAGKAVGEFTQFITDSIKAAIAADKANADLKSALGAPGREVDANAKHFIDYASRLQKLTIYDDEAVKGAQALLLQLTTLDRDGIDRATRGAIGLASVLGIDLQSAAMMVTKAMEGNYVALSRYGIKVSETGTAEEKRNELLQKLEGFYKRATDATGTFAGKQAQLKNNIDELKEGIGQALLPLLAQFIDMIKPIIDKSVEWVEKNKNIITGIANLVINLKSLAIILQVIQTSVDQATWIFKKTGEGLQFLGEQADKVKIGGKSLADTWRFMAGDSLAFTNQVGKAGKELSTFGLIADIYKRSMEAANEATRNAHPAFKLTDEWAKQFGITLRTKLIEQINDTKEALRRLRGSAEETPAAIKILEDRITKLSRELDGAKTAAAKCGISLGKTLVPAARDLNEEFAKTPYVVAQAYVKSASALSVWIKKNKDAIETVVAFSQQALGLIQSAYSNYYANQTAKLDEESRKKQEAMDADYERRKKDIEDSTLSEEEKQTALAALDKEYKDAKELAEKEYEAKKKKLQREAAEKDKAVAIVQAVINTAVAVSKALPNLILVALAAAMGLAQIAIIKSQAIPLAKGAMFDRPTLLAGGRYEMGDAGPEAALPVEPLMKRIEQAILRGMALKGGGQTTVHVYIGTEELDKRIIKTVVRQGDLRRFKIPSAVVS